MPSRSVSPRSDGWFWGRLKQLPPTPRKGVFYHTKAGWVDSNNMRGAILDTPSFQAAAIQSASQRVEHKPAAAAKPKSKDKDKGQGRGQGQGP
eukprot:2223547-Rhodomonas_salina.1